MDYDITLLQNPMAWLEKMPCDAFVPILDFFCGDKEGKLLSTSPWAAHLSLWCMRALQASRSWVGQDLSPIITRVFGKMAEYGQAGYMARYDMISQKFIITGPGSGRDKPVLYEEDSDPTLYYVIRSEFTDYLVKFDNERGTNEDERIRVGAVFNPHCTCNSLLCHGACDAKPAIVSVAEVPPPLGFELIVPIDEEVSASEAVSVRPSEGMGTTTARLVAPFVLPLTIYDRPLVLDFGSGDGRRARAIRELIPGARVVAYDNSLFSNSPYVGLEVRDFIVKFDVIVCNQVLHHVRCWDGERFFRDLAERLSDKGILVIREDIWNGTVEHWRELDSAHAHYHDGLGPATFLTRDRLLSYIRSAGLFMANAVPPDNFPVLRARGWRGQVYMFVKDDTIGFSHLHDATRRLMAQYSRLKVAVLGRERVPDKVSEMVTAATTTGPIPYALIRYLQNNWNNPTLQFEYTRRYAMTRFLSQSDELDLGSLDTKARDKAADKFYLLAFCVASDNGAKLVTHGDIMNKSADRVDVAVAGLTKQLGKQARSRLVDAKVLLDYGGRTGPGPKFLEHLLAVARN